MNKKKILKNTLILTVTTVTAASASVIFSAPKTIPAQNTFALSPQSAVATDVLQTAISARADLPQTYAHKFMGIIMVGDRVNQTELLKYINIDGLPARTTITVEQTAINYVSGQISIRVSLDRYYNAQLELVTEVFTSPLLTLKLLPRPTITAVTTKATYPTDLRIDKVIASFAATNDGGEITNLANLEKYVSLQGIPTGAKLSINTLPVIDELNGELAFVITADRFYGSDYELNTSDYNSPLISLSGFVPRYEPTTVTAKNAYDQALRVDLFKTKILVNNKVDTNFLKQYIDFIAVPPAATINVLIKTIDNKSGVINLDIELSQYYNSDNNLVSGIQTYPIALTLAPKIYQTTITLLPSYSETITLAQLQTLVGTGSAINQAALEKYIMINNAPAGAKVTSVAYNSAANGQISLTVTLDKYYDENLELKSSGVFNVVIFYREFNLKTNLTKLTDIPKDIVAINFFDHINPINTATGKREVNYAALAQFVDLSTLPPEALLSIDLDDRTQYYIDALSGELGFKILTSYIYDDQNVLAATPTFFAIDLKLLPSLPNTIIKINPSYQGKVSLNDFLNYVTIDNKIQTARLGEYLDLSLVPDSANFDLQNVQQDADGQVTFNVVSDKWYKGNQVIDGEYIEYAMKLDLVVNPPSLNWLWITLGSVAGVILLVGLVFYIQKKRDKKIFLF